MKDSILIKIEQITSRTIVISESEVVHLMVLIRKYLEYEETRDYFVLKFFCDWSMHTSIDRSLPAMELLREINKIINKLKQIPNNDLIMNKISNIVSFQKLKSELNNFFQNTGISKEIITNELLWNNFVEKYIEIILDCSLVLAKSSIKGKIKQIRDEIIEHPIKRGAHVVGFVLSYVNNSWFQGSKELSPNTTLSLVLLTSDTTRLVIPLSKNFLS